MDIFDLIRYSKIKEIKVWIENITANQKIRWHLMTPLAYAFWMNKENIAILFIEKNLYIFEADTFGETSLHVASACGCIKGTSLLIGKGANVNVASKDKCLLPIHYAAARENLDIVSILIDNGSEINALDYKGKSPLFASICHNRTCKVLKTLLDEGASLYNIFDHVNALLEFVDLRRKYLLNYYFKLQSFILVCKNNNMFSRSVILKFTNTFKFSFK